MTVGTHHTEKHLRTSAPLRDIVLGISDGLTVPFALAAGLSGALESNALILTAGIAEIVAGAVSMGLGGYLAGRTEIEHYANELKREYSEVEHIPEEEKNEVRSVLTEFGLSPGAREELVEAIVSDRDRWVQFMMRFELGIEEPSGGHPSFSALRIGLSYAIGGLIPLSAYVFASTPKRALLFSSLLTITALGVFGFFKAKMTGQRPVRGAVHTMAIGIAAAAVAYWIARQFSQ